MDYVKLEFNYLSVPSKIEKARTIMEKMTNNVNFPTPDPSLASIKAATDELEESFLQAAGGGVDRTAVMREKEEILKTFMSLLAVYVQLASKGNKVIILSSGMSVRNKPGSPTELDAPAGLKIKYGNGEGNMNLSWESQGKAGAKSYMIQITSDPLGSGEWKMAGTSTKASFTVMGLEPGKKCWFRIAAVGSAGQSPWCDPIMKMTA